MGFQGLNKFKPMKHTQHNIIYPLTTKTTKKMTKTNNYRLKLLRNPGVFQFQNTSGAIFQNKSSGIPILGTYNLQN